MNYDKMISTLILILMVTVVMLAIYKIFIY